MKKPKDNSTNGSSSLRKKAEEKLNTSVSQHGSNNRAALQSGSGEVFRVSESEHVKLIHELQVHQIELEMQNDELLQAKELAEFATRRYAELYDFAPAGYFTLTAKGEIIELNLRGSLMIDRDRSYLKHSRFALFVTDDTKPIFNSFFSRALTSKVMENCEVKLSVAGLMPMQVLLAGIAVGNGEQCLISMVDISGSRRTEAALRESEERYKSLFYRAGEGIFIMRTDGLLLEVNESFARMHGYTVDEMKNMYLKELDTPETAKMIPERMKKILAGDTMTFEVEHFHKDGHTFPLEVSAGLVSHDGEDFIQTFHRDITARKEAELVIKNKNEELQKANAEKDKYFSIVAHDLRNPFQTLLGFTRLMVDELPTLTPDETLAIALSMRNSATKLFNLLENLLEWSKIQRGLISYNPELINLSKEIAATIDLNRSAADKKTIGISCNVPNDLFILTDKHIFESLMRNLVFNAIKFTQKGGKVTITVTGSPNQSVQVTVTDTGIGMSPEILEKLFRLDQQVNRAGTEKEPGSGLGLIICKDLLEKNGGRIWAESQEGEGSSFHFTIPQG